MNIDIERLREDLRNECMGAMFNGFPTAVIELSDIDNASDRELIEIAKQMGFNLNNYIEYER